MGNYNLEVMKTGMDSKEIIKVWVGEAVKCFHKAELNYI